jgi:hypothetical protein
VINNPDWEGICWLYRDTVDLEGNLDTTAVLIAPPLIQLEEEDSKDSSPACKDTLGPEECKKAGGFYVKETFPNYCKCP